MYVYTYVCMYMRVYIQHGVPYITHITYTCSAQSRYVKGQPPIPAGARATCNRVSFLFLCWPPRNLHSRDWLHTWTSGSIASLQSTLSRVDWSRGTHVFSVRCRVEQADGRAGAARGKTASRAPLGPLLR